METYYLDLTRNNTFCAQLHCHVLMRLFLYFGLSCPLCLVLDASKFMEVVCKLLCQVLVQFAFFLNWSMVINNK